jgi:hypothetical protein
MKRPIKTAQQYFKGCGTTIMIFASKQAIYIAADSKRRVINSTNGQSTEIVARKINRHNSTWYAFAGNTDITDAAGNYLFDTQKIVAEILQQNISFEDTLIEINSKLIAKLTSVLTTINPLSNFRYVEEFAKSRYIFEIALCTFINGAPRLVVKEFKLTGDKNSWRIYSEEPMNIKDIPLGQQPVPYGLGETAEIMKFMSSGQSAPGVNSLQTFLDYLINLQIRATPTVTGPPVRILQINQNNTFTWLQNPF